jgi:hypothetical protein
LPIEKNFDGHAWRDAPDLRGRRARSHRATRPASAGDAPGLIDYDKVLRTTRLTLNTVWLLSNDEARPPKPQG